MAFYDNRRLALAMRALPSVCSLLQPYVVDGENIENVLRLDGGWAVFELVRVQPEHLYELIVIRYKIH